MSAQPQQSTAVAKIEPPRLPYHPAVKDRFGMDIGAWRTLTDTVFPAARSENSVIMALNYCRARKLDVFKKPVNIVPVWDSKRNAYVETVWPSINEHRTTAHRTKGYAGLDAPVFGPDATTTFSGRVKKNNQYVEQSVTVTYPESVTMTAYRIVQGVRCPFTVTIYWLETYGKRGGTDLPNSMWATRPRGQFVKCGEAAVLRMTFPEELGELTAEEMEGQIVHHAEHSVNVIDASAVPSPTQPAEQVNGKEATMPQEMGGDDNPPQRQEEDAQTGETEAQEIGGAQHSGTDDVAEPDEATPFQRFCDNLSVTRNLTAAQQVWQQYEERANQSDDYDAWSQEFATHVQRIAASR